MRRAFRYTALAAGIAAGASLTSSCAGPGDDVETSAADGSLRGELALYISDEPGVGSSTQFFLKDTAGTERRLLFDVEPDIAPGAWVKVWGTPQGEALRVLSYERMPTPATVQSALINATPFAARSFAFILVDIGGGINRTTDDVMARMINAPDSIRNYYRGDSYGMQDITNVVIGPLTYTPTGCDTSAMVTALRPMVDAQGGPFQHYLWYYGSKNDSCSWSGLASVGTPDSPQRNTWYNASTSCVVLVQEPGHNFGMQHSSSLACGTSAAFADDPNECSATEYGDRFDPMGGGCRHMNAWQKDYQGWFGGCNGVKVTNSGTFTLVPLELSCTGVQYLQIKAPKARPFSRPAAGGGSATTENMDFYYLELRTPVDFDGMLGNSSALSARVLVHVAAERRSRTQRGIHPFLLDMNPSTTGNSGLNDAGLAVGQTFTDPGGGLTITPTAIGNTGATIVVTYTSGGTGAPTCIDGSSFAPPGPGMESCVASPTGAGGAGGATGTGGRGGAGGSAAGSGGRGGSTGGRGGAGGATGGAGSIGPGNAGTTGTAGTGDTGEAGTTGGTSTPGSGGATGGGGGGPPGGRGVSGGCACDTAGSGTTTLAGVLAMMFGLVVVARRPRRQASRRR